MLESVDIKVNFGVKCIKPTLYLKRNKKEKHGNSKKPLSTSLVLKNEHPIKKLPSSYPLLANVPILYPLKTLENLWFSCIFSGCKMETLAIDGFTKNIFIKKGDFKLIDGRCETMMGIPVLRQRKHLFYLITQDALTH